MPGNKDAQKGGPGNDEGLRALRPDPGRAFEPSYLPIPAGVKYVFINVGTNSNPWPGCGCDIDYDPRVFCLYVGPIFDIGVKVRKAGYVNNSSMMLTAAIGAFACRATPVALSKLKCLTSKCSHSNSSSSSSSINYSSSYNRKHITQRITHKSCGYNERGVHTQRTLPGSPPSTATRAPRASRPPWPRRVH